MYQKSNENVIKLIKDMVALTEEVNAFSIKCVVFLLKYVNKTLVLLE